MTNANSDANMFRPWVQKESRPRSASVNTPVSSCPASPLSRCPSECSSTGGSSSDDLWLSPVYPVPIYPVKPLSYLRSVKLQAYNLQRQEAASKKKKRDKKHKCDRCPNAFSNQQQLIAHVRSHTGEKPFGCEQCLKRFTRNEELTRHKRIHTGEKPHPCPFCNKRFGRKDHLKKHENTHNKSPTGQQFYVASQAAVAAYEQHMVFNSINQLSFNSNKLLLNYHPFV